MGTHDPSCAFRRFIEYLEGCWILRLHLFQMRYKYIILLGALVVCLLPDTLLAQGCSMCKAVVESGESNTNAFGGAQNIGLGLNNGILYLMVVPYLLMFLLFRKRIVSFFKEFAGAQG